ncbi:hypothetical protein IPV09_07575 [Tessaracoccus sp. SD287]|uniref:hypothetical protein n=1 Tax=Tessaracoccus sp. SD287 TaxID=2782008 RepID=UPI001A95FE6B|nr:hypothetical protein [Tessaracoccus sp. SD287]MBO1031195.1 hypothetical protein [Tessaracoccus sp. SD287]
MRLIGATWQRWLNLALVVLGVLVVLYGAFVQGRGAETCRGVEMRPGDVCHKSTYTQLHTAETQTYEQRKQAALAQRPVVVVSGLVIAGFGGFLYRRSGTPRGQASVDEERLLNTH